mmetsp:Transcript_27711/g.59184  ORF Transcript_27711/g.59184 Transcript_27711/m.59184 type:complete len:296 (-) Transcript_27711:131-1018(-)|eukprot:CAMPEP_0172312142 /NCGR_PEP_ID=MMETSP1058-20130122/16788_1 /TAXON_ID=83371 /ORGANISM="Detonula confervacea, Strain CCMP 353" /LENGTH=295 /DNA_ID=CAMNT_0013025515 /DNA_START=97 /DNA_END=984 /DNA_ORIENTATION=+
MSNNNIKVIGQSTKVVEHDGLTIEETIGNVATKNDDLSLALVTIAKPTSEPWLTLHYDEWIHVLEGWIELHQENKDDGTKTVTKVNMGQTVFIPKGSRMQPVFPVPSKYIPVCLPAFSPGRCIREEGTELSDVSARLNELHNVEKKSLSAEEVNVQFNHVNTLYHMCPSILYDYAVSSKAAYFPPTFVQDGRFTHATAVPAHLITTANHFYTSTEGDWICFELDREVLEKKLGIVTVFESAKPVGDVDTNDGWKDSVFPHIFGGIPVHVEGVVTNVYKMKRSEGGTFLGIDGLVD